MSEIVERNPQNKFTYPHKFILGASEAVKYVHYRSTEQ